MSHAAHTSCLCLPSISAIAVEIASATISLLDIVMIQNIRDGFGKHVLAPGNGEFDVKLILKIIQRLAPELKNLHSASLTNLVQDRKKLFVSMFYIL